MSGPPHVNEASTGGASEVTGWRGAAASPEPRPQRKVGRPITYSGDIGYQQLLTKAEQRRIKRCDEEQSMIMQ